MARASDSIRKTPVVLAVERAAPTVVSITSTVASNSPFDWYYGSGSSSGEGSGVIIDPRGIILTNAHVVERAVQVQVHFADEAGLSNQGENGTSARLVGIARDLDLAVLEVNVGQTLPAVAIGSSADLMLGESVISIGNPFGLNTTVTTGIISAKNRVMETDKQLYQDFIQTDASINPGNSGGPLLNIEGKMIGITTAIHAEGEGIGFAIPIDRAIKVARDLTQFGTVQVPWLGVDLADVMIRGRHGPTSALRIERVHSNTSAQSSGLTPGDFIVGVDGRDLLSRADLNSYLASYSPGQSTRLEISRNGQTLQSSIVTSTLPDSIVSHSLHNVLGIQLGQTVTGRRNWQGVQVVNVSPTGSFAYSRLMAGDVIVAINGQSVTNANQVQTALKKAKSGHRSSALFAIKRGEVPGQFNLSI